MILYYNNTELNIEVSDDSCSHEAIMGENVLLLNFSVPVYTEIPLGSYCYFNGTKYTHTKPENLTRHGKRNLEVSLNLKGPYFHLAKYKVRNIVTKRLKFSITLKPLGFLQLFVDNLNMRDSGWTVGSCIDAAEQTLTFTYAFIDAALKDTAEKFNTEYEIVGKEISLKKVEYNKDSPLSLSYGKENGFMLDCGRFNFEDNVPIEVLFVDGGERNIDSSKYGSKQLLLPKSQSLVYEGRIYVTDAEGLSIFRGDKALSTYQEDTLDCTHIYPSRVGTVSAVEENNSLYDIIDTSIPESLDYSLYVIAGEKATIIFQTGKLAGREFDIESDSNGNLTGYVHEERRFKIISQEIDGENMPSAVFTPAEGDKYAVFGIQLPDAYICDNTSKTGASWDMFLEGAKYLYENEDPRFSFTGKLVSVWAKKNWATVGPKIKLGGYTSFSDIEYQTTPVLIRITDIVRYVNKPEAPEIQLSNVTVGGNVRSDLRKINNNEFNSTERHKESISFTKRRFRDARESQALLEQSLLTEFTNTISPITVNTMQAIFGSESLQFEFIQSLNNTTAVEHSLTFDINGNLICEAGYIIHFTLGITDIQPNRVYTKYKRWTVTGNTFALANDNKAYYLYIKASKTLIDNVGGAIFIISSTAIGLNDVTGYYHFLCAIISSKVDNIRSIQTWYGFTEITPGRVTAYKFISPDGYQYLDFLNRTARIGGENKYIAVNTDGTGDVILKGVINQSPSGVQFPIPTPRGVYDEDIFYYKGDIVTHNGSSYMYTNNTSTKGNIPTDPTYWDVWSAAGINAQIISIKASSLIFRYADRESVTPDISTIRLICEVHGIENATYKWYYWNTAISEWAQITGETNSYYDVTHNNSDYFGANVISAKIKCSVNNSDILTDEVTIIKLFGGSDSLNVFLSNQSHLFKAGVQYALESTDKVYIYGYKGTTEVETTVGTIEGTIDNKLTAEIFDNGSKNTSIDIKALTTLDTLQGTLIIPVTIEGKTFNLNYSWVLAITGAVGAQGKRPASLNGPTAWKKNVLYLQGNVDIVPAEAFQDLVRNLADGKSYYCTRTHVSTDANRPDVDCAANDIGVYWTRGNNFDYVATNLFSATRAAIENLIVDYLQTAPAGKRVEIMEDFFAAYDDNGHIKTKIHGGALSNSSTAATSYSCASPAATSISGIAKNGNGSIILGSITPVDANNEITVPAYMFTLQDVVLASDSMFNIDCVLLFGNYLIDSFRLGEVNEYGGTYATSAKKISLPQGVAATLRLEYSYVIASGSGEVTSFKLKATAGTSTAAIVYNNMFTEIASDGMKSQWSSAKYFMVKYLSSTQTIMRFLNENTMLDINSNGVQISRDGGTTILDVVGSTNIKKIEVITTYPEILDSNTLYIKTSN